MRDEPPRKIVNIGEATAYLRKLAEENGGELIGGVNPMLVIANRRGFCELLTQVLDRLEYLEKQVDVTK